VSLNVQVNTAAIADWTKVELFNYAQEIGEVLAGGAPSGTAIVSATLSAGDVHALTALVTLADGVTIRTTNIVTVLTAPLSGDYNHDGTVDAADYVVWRKTDGTPAGYDAWRANFSQPSGSGSVANANATIPEPTTLMMLIVAAVGVRLRRRQIASECRKLNFA